MMSLGKANIVFVESKQENGDTREIDFNVTSTERFQQPDCCLKRDINQTFDSNQMQTKRERVLTDSKRRKK